MPASKAQQKAVHKYTKENYDRFLVTMKPKGHLETVKAHAAAQGESVNGFINRAIDHEMGRDASGSPIEAPTALLGVGAVSLPSDALKTAREAAEASGEALPVFIGRAVETQAQRDKLSRKMKGGKANE